MYLHIGKKDVVPQENIIAILNTDLFEDSEINSEFYNISFEEGFIEKNIEESEIKSYIITEGVNKRDKSAHMMTKIYASSISSSTLIKRIEQNKLDREFIEKELLNKELPNR